MGLTISSTSSDPMKVLKGAEACGSVAQAVSTRHQCIPQQAAPLQKSEQHTDEKLDIALSC